MAKRSVASTPGEAQSGFATVAAIAVCASLATIAVALIQLASSAEKKAQQAVEQAGREEAAQSAIALTIADLVNAAPEPLATSRHAIGNWTIEVTASNEQSKTNLFTADETALVAAFKEVSDERGAILVHEAIAARRDAPSIMSLSLQDALTELGAQDADLGCADDWLTVYGSSIDPLASGAPSALDGGIVNLRARVVAPAPADSVREEIVLITGDSVAPIKRLSTRWFRQSAKKGCHDDEGP